jgi:ketosteroid isomerase-like protein
VPKLEKEASAIHDGDVEPRMALWSREDPVTLFGAVMTRSGWDVLEQAFVRLAGNFGGSESFRFEVMAARVSGDLGYVAGIERSRASRAGGEAVEYALRHDDPETPGWGVESRPPSRRPVRRGEQDLHAVTRGVHGPSGRHVLRRPHGPTLAGRHMQPSRAGLMGGEPSLGDLRKIHRTLVLWMFRRSCWPPTAPVLCRGTPFWPSMRRA